MSTQFTGTPIWREFIIGPSDGDEASGLSVSDMGVLLADRTMFLLDQLAQQGLLERDADFVGGKDANGGGTWSYEEISAWEQTALNTDELHIGIPLPPLTRLLTFAIDLDPLTGRADLPATMPRIRLRLVERATGVSSLTAAVVDSTSVLGEYEAYHSIAANVAVNYPTLDINSTDYRVVLVVQGEDGVNAQIGSLIKHARFTYEFITEEAT